MLEGLENQRTNEQNMSTVEEFPEVTVETATAQDLWKT